MNQLINGVIILGGDSIKAAQLTRVTFSKDVYSAIERHYRRTSPQGSGVSA